MNKREKAALYAIFLGSFGIHKFYLKQPVHGVLYLFFCWTGIPTILGLFEGFAYLFLPDEYFR
jgi:TM2 domain-containing membrane protein YozV